MPTVSHRLRIGTRARAVSIVSVGLSALVAAMPGGPALSQTSSWSSRTEIPAESTRSPPGTVVLPKSAARPRLIEGPAHEKPTRAPPAYTSRLDPRSSSLKAGAAAAVKPPPVPAGADPAYQAFDNARFITALELAQKAAAAGQPEAHTLMGRIHEEGHGVKRDPALAARWYARAAELGDPEGAFALGLMYVEGRGVEKNLAAAAAMFERSAATGHVYANYNLGLMFLSGRGKPENPIRGAQHIAYAAEKGIAAAQYDLATLYINGHGVEADGWMASRWLRRAAELGLPEAQFDYAIMLLKGQGLNADRPDALRYLRRAAESGLAAAQNRLAHALVEGLGGNKNLTEAAKWRILAREQGLPDDALDGAVKRLPQVERQTAELQASQWRDRAIVGAGQN